MGCGVRHPHRIVSLRLHGNVPVCIPATWEDGVDGVHLRATPQPAVTSVATQAVSNWASCAVSGRTMRALPRTETRHVLTCTPLRLHSSRSPNTLAPGRRDQRRLPPRGDLG